MIGDIQDSEDGENLLELLWQKDLAFLVLLGDVVRSGKAGYHRRLAHEIHELGPPAFPVFYVPGNRDVKTGEDPLDFTLEDFRARYGASSFHVSLHGSLFVFAEIPDPSWNMARSLDWVEEVLQTEGPRHDRIFLFSHVPVSFSDVVDGRYLFDPAGKRLKGILERYPVDYHVAAHHHGYLRTRKGDTVYLVTGGGGGTIRDENWQGAHHAMLFELGPDSVTERLVVIPHEPGLGDTFEGLVVGELLPQVRRRPRLLGWVALVHLILLAAVVAVVRRRSPGSPAAPA